MNRIRILVMLVLFMLISPMTVAADDYGEKIFEQRLEINEGVEIEYSINIEVVKTSTDIIDSAKFRISSYLKPQREMTIFQGDMPTEYETNSGANIYIEVISVHDDSVLFRVSGSENWRVTDYYTVEVEGAESEAESEAVAVPELEIVRTFDAASVVQGQTVEVTLKIKNIGNGTATNIVLDEPAVRGTYQDGYSSSIDDIAAGETRRTYYNLKIVDAKPGTCELDSTILNYRSESGTAYSSESATSVLEIIAEEIKVAELVISISIDSVDDVIICGDEFTATIRIENIGNATTGRVNIKSYLPDDVRVVDGESEPIYESIKPGDYEEYDLTLIAYEPGRHTIEMEAMWGDQEASDSLEFWAEESDLERYYLYILMTIPVGLLLVGIIKRHRDYSF